MVATAAPVMVMPAPIPVPTPAPTPTPQPPMGNDMGNTNATLQVHGSVLSVVDGNKNIDTVQGNAPTGVASG